MSSRVLQSILIKIYHFVYRTGFLSTRLGWRVYSSTYRLYKQVFDRELDILRNFLKPGDIVVDIGANVGSSTIKFSNWVSPLGKVIAIEPEPRNCSELRRIINSSKKYLAVTVIEAAVTNRCETVCIKLNALNPGDHRLSSEGSQVVGLTLDFLIKSLSIDTLRVIKIDVQGAEPLVIAGSIQTLKEYMPIIFSEIYDEGLRSFGFTVSGYVQTLVDIGYVPYIVKDSKHLERIEPVKLVDLCIRHGYLDAVFLPKDEKNDS